MIHITPFDVKDERYRIVTNETTTGKQGKFTQFRTDKMPPDQYFSFFNNKNYLWVSMNEKRPKG